jgi:hypothetical protein
VDDIDAMSDVRPLCPSCPAAPQDGELLEIGNEQAEPSEEDLP